MGTDMYIKKWNLTISTFFLIVLCFIAPGINAQEASLQKEIDNQVWKPFIQSFNNMDTKGFMLLHSKDLIRVGEDDAYIVGYEQYYRDNAESNEKRRKDLEKNNDYKRTIALRFIRRIAKEGKAMDIGYYKVSTITAGKISAHYGKFQVLLRKELGVWKILMDADTSEMADEPGFLSAKPMEQ